MTTDGVRPGDVVRYIHDDWPLGQSASGPATADRFGVLRVCGYAVGGSGYTQGRTYRIEILERAPQPLHDCPDCTHLSVPS